MRYAIPPFSFFNNNAKYVSRLPPTMMNAVSFISVTMFMFLCFVISPTPPFFFGLAQTNDQTFCRRFLISARAEGWSFVCPQRRGEGGKQQHANPSLSFSPLSFLTPNEGKSKGGKVPVTPDSLFRVFPQHIRKRSRRRRRRRLPEKRKYTRRPSSFTRGCRSEHLE